jgi:hypothetical protein|tara:strand:+ start:16524 stop:16754 length:231 start_codon:yes stop_codon:yes gene_type:complete
MRQVFDVGDFVKISRSFPSSDKGIVLKTELINAHMLEPDQWVWHVDEYRCKVQLFSGSSQWVRAKWLEHISKATKE